MKTDRPDTTEGNGEHERAQKVVRLPREWVGPPEELVPMGSRPAVPEAVPEAQDFWTERAPTVHHAIKAPDVSESRQAPGVRSHRSHSSSSGGSRRRPRRVSFTRSPRHGHASEPIPRTRRTRAWGIGLSCLVLAAASGVAVALESGSSGPHARGSSSPGTIASLSKLDAGLTNATDRMGAQAARDVRARLAAHRLAAAHRQAEKHMRARRTRERRLLTRPRAARHGPAPVSSGASDSTSAVAPIEVPASPATSAAGGSTGTGSRHTTPAYGEGGLLGAGHSSGSS